jgi:hypothetical protein
MRENLIASDEAAPILIFVLLLFVFASVKFLPRRCGVEPYYDYRAIHEIVQPISSTARWCSNPCSE